MTAIITELCALGRRYLASDKDKFAAAARARDYGRADKVLDEHASLSAALERQERLAADSSP